MARQAITSNGASLRDVAARRGRTRAQLADADLRQLIARELHDRVAQTLTSMLIDLENFKTEQVGRKSVLRQMDDLQGSTRQVLNSLRQLLHELRGTPPVEESFSDAVQALVARFRERTSMLVSLTILPGWPARVKSPAALNLYRIIEEALVNVRQHSGAATVHVILQPHSDEELSVSISDDGRGLEADDPGPLGMGMVGMKERALFLGAKLGVESVPGSGTTVRLIVRKEMLC
ncbi:MAG TPA: sensor histidine kinase [Candidatus Dormibacteraeota bacterium]|nr:sensor histidine kinase [Candidatus Dormibacteraeota bacterium]